MRSGRVGGVKSQPVDHVERPDQAIQRLREAAELHPVSALGGLVAASLACIDRHFVPPGQTTGELKGDDGAGRRKA